MLGTAFVCMQERERVREREREGEREREREIEREREREREREGGREKEREREGGREGGREREREGEGGRERESERERDREREERGGREGRKEGGREGGKERESVSRVSGKCVYIYFSDVQRARSIIRSIVSDLEQPQDLSEVLTEEDKESLTELQKMLDIVESPLFTAVLDITEECKKVHSYCVMGILEG